MGSRPKGVHPDIAFHQNIGEFTELIPRRKRQKSSKTVDKSFYEIEVGV